MPPCVSSLLQCVRAVSKNVVKSRLFVAAKGEDGVHPQLPASQIYAQKEVVKLSLHVVTLSCPTYIYMCRLHAGIRVGEVAESF